MFAFRHARRLGLVIAVLVAAPMLVHAVDVIGLVVHGGTPVPKATATLKALGPPTAGLVKSAVASDTGHFVILGLAPGDYMLSCGGAEVKVHIDFDSSRVVCTQ